MGNRRKGITKFANDTKAVIADAKKLRDDIDAWCNENCVAVSTMLVKNGIAASTVSNSTRSYWLLTHPNKRIGDWAKDGNRSFTEGFEIGIFRQATYNGICEIFGLDPKKYFIRFNEDKPKDEKEEETAKVPVTKEGYHHDYGTDLFDIKKLLRVNNILLEQLIKKWS